MRSVVVEADFGATAPLLTSLRALGWECRRSSLTVETLPPCELFVVAVGAGPGAERCFHQLEKARPAAPTLAIIDRSAGEHVVKLAAERCDEFVLWEPMPLELVERIRRLLRVGREGEAQAIRLSRETALTRLVGEDTGFRQIVERIPRLAASDAPVLITGETGTGKEMVARAIHHLGPRRGFPFVAVDCGAFPDSLLENELYGHARGAFTDARADHQGLARVAEGGVLFLDEVDALSVGAQSKLLRFLEDRTFKPLGSTRIVTADVRVLAATNQDLQTLIRAGRFRADLFFRLSVLPVRLIALRDRPGDIAPLAHHFLESWNQRSAERKQLSPAAEERLMSHRWPGNVRELRNVIERAVALTGGAEIGESDLLLEELEPASDSGPFSYREAKARALAQFERAFVREALHRNGNNISRAARETKQDRRALGKMVKRLDLDP
jgi:DNA-binding NtrC family response regulator